MSYGSQDFNHHVGLIASGNADAVSCPATEQVHGVVVDPTLHHGGRRSRGHVDSDAAVANRAGTKGVVLNAVRAVARTLEEQENILSCVALEYRTTRNI